MARITDDASSSPASLAARAAGFLIAGAAGWLIVGASELREVSLESGLEWIACIHLAHVAVLFSLLTGSAVLVLHALRHWLVPRVNHADTLISGLVLAASAQPAWLSASALAGGNLVADSGFELAVRLTCFVLLTGLYLTLWLHHLALCGAPGVAWPGWLARPLARIPAPLRTIALFGFGLAMLAILINAIDHELRAYLFLAVFLLPAAWLLAASLVFGLCARAGRTTRMTLGLATFGLLAASFLILPPERGVLMVRSELARHAGAASLSDVTAGKERAAQHAALDFSRPQNFNCRAANAEVAAATRPASHRNVILISVDALRKDAVASMNEGRPNMPALAAFGRESVNFERAVTTYPATLFALGSALTGLSPSSVLFAPEVPANIFTRAQHATERLHVFLPTSHWFRKSSVRSLFVQNAPVSYGSHAAESTDRLIDELTAARAAKQRVFEWVHYYEPHIHGEQGDTVTARRKLYTEEIGAVDAQLARLFETLGKLHYFDDSLVIFFADHGEALGELGFLGHHVYLNHFLADIPLFVRAPGRPPGRDENIVAISDIATTVLEWLGLPAPRTETRSLLAAPAKTAERFVVSEAFPLRGDALFTVARARIHSVPQLLRRIAQVRHSALDYSPKVSITTARYRLIVDRESGAEELYDRVKDPDEAHNLAQDDLPIHATLSNELAAWAFRQSETIYCSVAKPAQNQ